MSTVDLLPTILETLGLPPAEGAEGASLLGGAPQGRVVIAESYPSPLLAREHERFRRIARAAYAGDLKLIATTTGERELYDLARDPQELDDRYDPDDPPRELEAALERWLDRPAAPAGPGPTLDDAAREQLRALGYAR